MSKSDGIAIKVTHVSKTFKLPHEKHDSLKGLFVNAFTRDKTYEKQHVLKGISFDIKKGEFFGIVGRNGSGKSTLLKLLAEIYTPDSGTIEINGKLTPFIELGVGFNPELTGRENVYMNGALLGFNRKEMDTMYDEIVDFAELEKFMDQKLKNYSSGMQVRLAFSIAIRANSEILLLDEVLAVGDEVFQKKCVDYFQKLKKEKRTVILVTHDMEAVRRFCDKALLIDKGKILQMGDSSKVAKHYTEINEEAIIEQQNTAKQTTQESTKDYLDASIEASFSGAKERRRIFRSGEPIIINVKTKAFEKIEDPVIGLTMENSKGETVFWTSTEKLGSKFPKKINNGSEVGINLRIDNIFGEDTYIVDVGLMNLLRSKTFARIDNALEIRVINSGKNGWLLQPDHKIKIIK